VKKYKIINLNEKSCSLIAITFVHILINKIIYYK